MRNTSTLSGHEKTVVESDAGNKLSVHHSSEEATTTPTKSFKLRNNQVQTISNGHAHKTVQTPTSIENAVLLQPEPTEYKKVGCYEYCLCLFYPSILNIYFILFCSENIFGFLLK